MSFVKVLVKTAPYSSGYLKTTLHLRCGQHTKSQTNVKTFCRQYFNCIFLNRTIPYWVKFFGHTVFSKTRGHLSRLALPTQRDGLSCLASPRLALRCAAWPGKTKPDPCSRPVATSGCSQRYYNDIVHNARCINIPFFSVRQAVFLYKHECLK